MANDPAGGSGDLPPSAKLIERLESKIAALDERIDALAGKNSSAAAGKIADLEKALADTKQQLDDAKAKRKRPASKPRDEDDDEDDVTEGLY